MLSIDAGAIDTKTGSESGAEVQIVDVKTGEPLPIKVNVLGPDSEAYSSALRVQSRRHTDRLMKRGRKSLSLDELQDDELELLGAVTTGWTSFSVGEERFAFDGAASAQALYRRFPAIRDQVLSFQRDRANFLPKSAKS